LKLYGHPRFLNLYNKHFAPLLRGVDTFTWDFDLYLLIPAEMPQTSQNSQRPHFSPPKTIRIPIVELEDVPLDTVFKSNVPIIGHELGHFVHETFMGGDDSGKWQEFAGLTGMTLDFAWRTSDLGKARHPYPHVPAYELFADTFRDWLQGKRLHLEAFLMGLWGQAAKVTKEQIDIFRAIWWDTGPAGQQALIDHLEQFNPRALVYLRKEVN